MVKLPYKIKHLFINGEIIIFAGEVHVRSPFL